jgi:putative hemolysin
MNTALTQVAGTSTIIVYILLLLLAMFFATLRAAFTLTGRAGADRLREKFTGAAKLLAFWEPRWHLLCATLLLWTVLMNAASVTCALFFVIRPGQPLVWPEICGVTLFTTLVLTITLNIVPQALSAGYADRISITTLPFIRLLAWPTLPIAWPLAHFEKFLRAHMLHLSDEEDRPTPEESIRSLVNETGHLDLDKEERDIITSVFEFGETVTREIMVPRVEMEGIEDFETVNKCADVVNESHYSRFPVYHESLDDIKGSIHVKDILECLTHNKGSQHVINLAKAVPFVPESMPINDLLQLLRTEQSQMAIVVDEYGGTAGLVTMEDIIEELVGEIQDEYDDDEEQDIHRLSDGSTIINARTPVDEVNEELSIHIPTGEEYDSVGGYICNVLGRIPRPGECVEGTDFHITVQSANARQVLTLRIQTHPDSGERENGTQ